MGNGAGIGVAGELGEDGQQQEHAERIAAAPRVAPIGDGVEVLGKSLEVKSEGFVAEERGELGHGKMHGRTPFWGTRWPVNAALYPRKEFAFCRSRSTVPPPPTLQQPW